MTEPPDLARLLQAARGGDRDALEQLVRRYYPRVRALVHRRLEEGFRRNNRWMLSAFSTGDIVQEVFVRVCSGLDAFAGRDEATWIQYLATVVHNRLLDAVRYHGAAQRDFRRTVTAGTGTGRNWERASPEPGPSSQAAIAEHLRIFQEVLVGLPRKQRTLLRLRLESGLPFAALAERIGYASADVARKAFYDAQARLLVRLRSHGVRPETNGGR